MSRYSDLIDTVGFTGQRRTHKANAATQVEPEEDDIVDETYVSLPDAIRFLTGYYSQVSAAVLEMKRIEEGLREILSKTPVIGDEELERRLKADQCFVNESFIRLRECLVAFMKKTQGVKLL